MHIIVKGYLPETVYLQHVQHWQKYPNTLHTIESEIIRNGTFSMEIAQVIM